MYRSKKENVVGQLRQIFNDNSLVVLAHQHGMSVAEMFAFRQKAWGYGVGVKVTKNRLAKRALEGTSFGGLVEYCSGPTLVAFSRDVVAAARLVVEQVKDNDKLSLVVGSVEGTVLSPDEVQQLAKLVSLDEQRSRVVGCLQAPASRMVALLQAPGAQLARVFGAYGS